MVTVAPIATMPPVAEATKVAEQAFRDSPSRFVLNNKGDDIDERVEDDDESSSSGILYTSDELLQQAKFVDAQVTGFRRILSGLSAEITATENTLFTRMDRLFDRVRVNCLPKLQQLERILASHRSKLIDSQQILASSRNEAIFMRLVCVRRLEQADTPVQRRRQLAEYLGTDGSGTTVDCEVGPFISAIVSFSTECAYMMEKVQQIALIVDRQRSLVAKQLVRISDQLYRASERLFKLARNTKLSGECSEDSEDEEDDDRCDSPRFYFQHN